MFNFNRGQWSSTDNALPPQSFTCYNCNNLVSSHSGYSAKDAYNKHTNLIYICHHCLAPHILDSNRDVMQKAISGKYINKLPDNIRKIYDEARRCMTIAAYTSAIMLFRKLLMHIAVEEGAKAGLKFIEYVNFISDKGIIPSKTKHMASKIKDIGNEVNHEIFYGTEKDAEDLLSFIEVMLLSNYEYSSNTP